MRRYYLFLAIFIFCLHLKAQKSSISGKVFSKATLSALPTAQLVLFKKGKYYRKTTVDHTGNYWFGHLNCGDYTLQIYHKQHCRTIIKEISISNGVTIRYDIGMMQNAVESNINSSDYVSVYYKGPYKQVLSKTPKQIFENNDINIISDVYTGHKISIRPPKKEPPRPQHKATHYADSFKPMEKNNPINTGF